MWIPIGGQVPVDEPVRLPPATPAEEEQLRMIADLERLAQWHYVGRCLYQTNQDGSAKTVTISGIDIGMLNARLKNLPGAWPLPGRYDSAQWPKMPPTNAISVISSPV